MNKIHIFNLKNYIIYKLIGGRGHSDFIDSLRSVTIKKLVATVLDIVSDISRTAFIGPRKRSCASWGKLDTLTADNATDFNGKSIEGNNFKKLVEFIDIIFRSFIKSYISISDVKSFGQAV